MFNLLLNFRMLLGNMIALFSSYFLEAKGANCWFGIEQLDTQIVERGEVGYELLCFERNQGWRLGCQLSCDAADQNLLIHSVRALALK